MIALPVELEERIERCLEGHSPSALRDAWRGISERYREGVPPRLDAEIDRLAYAAGRLPPAFAAIARACEEIAPFLPSPPRTLLDLGAGPGTATLAARAVFPELAWSVQVEPEAGLRELAARLMPDDLAVTSIPGRLPGAPDVPEADLAVFGWSLGEIGGDAAISAVEEAAQKAEAWLAVEPGTPRGFAGLRAVREYVRERGWRILGPCTHAGACPIDGTDWCHFAVRLPRSARLRFLKGGDRGFEDEKFAWLAAAPAAGEPAGGGRILRRPAVHAGHVTLDLCTPEGRASRTISRRDRATFRAARRASWGDRWA
jgi:ribosomal protein RSM22 (predicted rRNA methylase)